MDHHHAEPVTVAPEQLNHAQHVWDGFVHMGKITVVGIAVIMSLLCIVFIGLR